MTQITRHKISPGMLRRERKGGLNMNVSGKRTSKWISMLLALAMLFSLLTVGVSAQTVADGTAENMVVLAAEEKGKCNLYISQRH